MITDARAIQFANEFTRPAAETLLSALGLIDGHLLAWRGKGRDGLIPDDGTELFDDGSPVDGRDPISGADAHVIAEFLVSVKEAFDSNPALRAAVARAAVNLRSPRSVR